MAKDFYIHAVHNTIAGPPVTGVSGSILKLLAPRNHLLGSSTIHVGLIEHRVSGAERYAKIYNIDYNRCIFCGYCVEACPTDAITHGHGFELATFNASNLVYRKEQMLAPRPAHMGENVVFNQADVDGGAPAQMVAGS